MPRAQGRNAGRQQHTPCELDDRDTIDRIRRTRPRHKWFSYDHIDRSGVRHGSNAHRVALRVLPSISSNRERSLFYYRGQIRPFGIEFHRHRIHAMARVFGSQPFSIEDVAEMTTTIIAKDFRAETVAVGHLLDSALDLIVEAGPTTLANEFVFGTIERRVATPADIGARVFQIRVFADKRPFRPFAQDDTRFFGR